MMALSELEFRTELLRYRQFADACTGFLSLLTGPGEEEIAERARHITDLIVTNHTYIAECDFDLLEKVIKNLKKYPIYAQRAQQVYCEHIDSKKIATSIKTFLKNKQLPEARKEFARLLQRNNAEQLMYFWDRFGSQEYQDLMPLCEDVQFEGVTTLVFSDQWHKEDDRCTVLEFYTRLICACSHDLTHIRFHTPQRGNVPQGLAHAFVECTKLISLDLSKFYLYEPLPLLRALSEHPTLQSLQIQVRLTDQLLELPDACYDKLTGLFLRGEALEEAISSPCAFVEHIDRMAVSYPPQFSDEHSNPVHTLRTKCKNISHFRVSIEGAAQEIPRSVTKLEVLLPQEDHEKKVIAPLTERASHLHKVTSLSFYGLLRNRVKMSAALPALHLFTTLTSLQVLNISPDVQEEGWLTTLVEKMPQLKNLAIRLKVTESSARELATVSKQLETVHLRLFLSKKGGSFTGEVNSSSMVKRLVLEASVRDGVHPLRQIESILAAVHPEELVIVYLKNEKGKKIGGNIAVASGKEDSYLDVQCFDDSFLFDRYPRLKRVLFYNKEPLDAEKPNWSWDESAVEFLTETLTTDTFGDLQDVDAFDLRYLAAYLRSLKK